MNLTLSEMENRVELEIGIDATSDYKTQVDQFINEGYEQFLLLTRCYQKEFTSTLTAGEDSYTMPTAMLSMGDVWSSLSGNRKKVEPLNLPEINRLRISDASSAAGPVRYYAVAGFNLLLLWPPASSGEVLSGTYVPRPAEMSAANDTPLYMPDEYHHAIVDYACWRTASLDDDASSAQGQAYKSNFRETVLLARKMMKKRGPRPMVRVNTRRRQRFPFNPSQDIG